MTITSAGGVEFARELGCNLVVLARECSIKELEKIQAAQGRAGSPLPAVTPLTNDGAHGVTRPTELPLEVSASVGICEASAKGSSNTSPMVGTMA